MIVSRQSSSVIGRLWSSVYGRPSSIVGDLCSFVVVHGRPLSVVVCGRPSVVVHLWSSVVVGPFSVVRCPLSLVVCRRTCVRGRLSSVVVLSSVFGLRRLIVGQSSAFLVFVGGLRRRVGRVSSSIIVIESSRLSSAVVRRLWSSIVVRRP